jgi:hypothetical protein
VNLIFVWQLGVLGMHGEVEIGVLLLLRVNDDILAILMKEIQIPPSTLMSILSHILMTRPRFGCRAHNRDGLLVRMASNCLLMGMRMRVGMCLRVVVGMLV